MACLWDCSCLSDGDDVFEIETEDEEEEVKEEEEEQTDEEEEEVKVELKSTSDDEDNVSSVVTTTDDTDVPPPPQAVVVVSPVAVLLHGEAEGGTMELPSSGSERRSSRAFNGAGACFPPPPRDSVVGPLPTPPAGAVVVEGGGVLKAVKAEAWLVYSRKNRGTLYCQWNQRTEGGGVKKKEEEEEEEKEGEVLRLPDMEEGEEVALAWIGCETVVPKYKITAARGAKPYDIEVEEKLSSIFPLDRLGYYKGWMEFVRIMTSFKGSLVILPSALAEPPVKVHVVFNFKKDNRLSVVEPGKVYRLLPEPPCAIAVVPGESTSFRDVAMDMHSFIAKAEFEGAGATL
eukprot:GHVS01030009.1.p1 GENE.GHVS01030009.1~~GHVS01030009.1.p1  ORF type:complete len:345 (+),score=126.59 GHVS01030009.1:36-1070(+)